MATEAPPTTPVPQAETELDEANITSCIARLQEVHVALRNLRETIPRVMESVLVDPPAPEQLQLHFAQAARAAASDVKAFTQTMEDPWSKMAFEGARESRAKNADDITSWLVTEHEDWLDVKKEDVDENIDLNGQDAGVSTAAEISVEDMQAVLEKFKGSHPSIEVSLEGGSRIIKMHLPSPAHIHFDIQPKVPDERGQGGYNIDSKEKTKLHKAILEAMVVPAGPNKLDSLLEMLASYVDVKSRPCVKCARLLDRNAQFPIKRMRKRTKQADGRYIISWEAYHSACT